MFNIFQVGNGFCWRVTTWTYWPDFHWSRPQDITETRCFDNNFCQAFVRCSSHFNKITLRPTVPARQLHCFQLRQPTSSVHSTGHRTARTQSGWLRGLGHFARASLPLPDPWRRPSERTTDCRMAPIWPEHHIDRAINQWRERLHGCVRENGGHFEHQI